MMAKKRLNLTELKEELNDISSYRRALHTRNVLEKLLWISIALCGTGFIFHIVQNQLIYWNENQVLITKKSVPLSELKSPAVTYCSKGLYKNGLAERMINYLDNNVKNNETQLPKEAVSIQVGILKTYIKKKVDDVYTDEVYLCTDDIWQFWCKVSCTLII